MPHCSLIARAFGATLLLASSAATASEPIDIATGETRSGPLETRNSSIRLGDEVSIDGNIRSRNGSIRVGQLVTAGNISTRNGSVTLGDQGQFGDIDTRNGAVRLGEGTQAGAIDSRNGAINIGRGANVGKLTTRNGAITVGEQARVDGKIETRNGAIRGGDGAHASSDVATRNGDIHWLANGRIDGNLTTRNGKVELDQTFVGRNLRGRGGDLILKQTEIGGDVIIEINDADERGGGWLWFGRTASHGDAGSIRITNGSEVHGDVIVRLPEDYDGREPTLEIDASSRVHGRLLVDPRVRLRVDGTVVGGTGQT